MKQTLGSVFGLAVLASVSLVSSASSALVSIDYVAVGNAGNAADTTGFGAVAYNYQIAKNETTVGQYCEFLNAVAKTDTYGLYNTWMAGNINIAGISRSGSDGNYEYSVIGSSANKPITYVSWFDAARFCNWLQNGQPSGAQIASTTETGAYMLNGATTGIILKEAAAQVWIPSENEWYKAAYYDATKGVTGGYWPYPTRSNTMTTNDIGVAGAANYLDANGYVSSPGRLTDVGAYGVNSDSFYGTNDQGGNVWEWNDAVVSGSSRGLRGGSWDYGDSGLASSYRNYGVPSGEANDIGFRVASVPEPASMFSTLAFVGCGLLIRRRGKTSY